MCSTAQTVKPPALQMCCKISQNTWPSAKRGLRQIGAMMLWSRSYHWAALFLTGCGRKPPFSLSFSQKKTWFSETENLQQLVLAFQPYSPGQMFLPTALAWAFQVWSCAPCSIPKGLTSSGSCSPGAMGRALKAPLCKGRAISHTEFGIFKGAGLIHAVWLRMG